jgi:hypothetical protein
MSYVGPICSSQKERIVQYIRRIYSRWHSHSFPYSVLTHLAYTLVVSVPVEEDNIHIHTSPSIPQVAPTRLTLRGQHCIRYKNVFTSCISDHKTFLGLHTPRYTVVTHRTMGMQPLTHDMDCSQANLVLRGRIWDSHHLAEGYLPSYLIVGASLQKVNPC